MSRTLTLVHDQAHAPAGVVDLGRFRTDRYRDLLDEARHLMLDGHEELALARCHDAIRVRRDGYEGLALAGSLSAMLGQLDQAVDYTRAAIRVEPGRPDAYYDLASTLLDMEQPQEALHWAEEGLSRLGKRQDDIVDFLCTARIEALTELGRFDEAEQALSEAGERTGDGLQLLVGAREFLESRRRQPQLRVL